MKTSIKVVGALVLMVSGTLASGAAMADHHDRHGHGGGHVRFGISIGIPIFASGFYPAPVYSYPAPAYTYAAPAYSYPAPAYTYPAPAYTYPTIAAPLPPVDNWYYCAASRAYYPYIDECPGGWLRVPAQMPLR